jgi:preprotein translocase subunit SecA
MGTDDLSAAIRGIREEAIGTLLDQFLPKNVPHTDWDLSGLADAVAKDFNTLVDPKSWIDKEPELEEGVIRQRMVDAVNAAYDEKVARGGEAIWRHVEKDIMLRTLDQQWRDHLAAMDYLRQGIHLRGYAQKDYRFEYKREAFELFAAMLERVKFDTVSTLSKIEVRTPEELDREEEERRVRLMRALQAQHVEASSAFDAGAPEPDEALPAGGGAMAALPGMLEGAMQGGNRAAARQQLPPVGDAQGTFVRGERKVGRNEPCPCGSGKKFKHCHGTLAE